MLNDKKVLCVIPARLNSTRFPQKIMSRLGGKSLLEWVWIAACNVPLFDEICFAIDSLETAHLIESFNGIYEMTDPAHNSGTERIASLIVNKKREADVIVNWQADEPFIHAAMINDLLTTWNTTTPIATLKKKIIHDDEITSPNCVKVVCNHLGEALYFSRSPIPYNHHKINSISYYKHIGLYAYTNSFLFQQTLMQTNHSSLAITESLEQLTWLEHKQAIYVQETCYETIGIDTPADLHKAILFLKAQKSLLSI